MILPLDYVQDITHALKVGVFLSFVVIFLSILSFILKTIQDENQNNL